MKLEEQFEQCLSDCTLNFLIRKTLNEIEFYNIEMNGAHIFGREWDGVCSCNPDACPSREIARERYRKSVEHLEYLKDLRSKRNETPKEASPNIEH